MKKIIVVFVIVAVAFSSCKVVEPVKKSIAYEGMYEQKPLAILIMPPINKSNNVDAKEYFHSTLSVPVCNAGYYTIPPFISMEILKKESAYDAEMFINNPVNKFGEIFGADVALFTIIHKWDKSALAAVVMIEIEYIFKSTSTGEILYQRKGLVNYDTSVQVQGGGLAGALIGMAASAINTAATKYVDVARACNAYTLIDIPAGKYHTTKHGLDGEEMAGQKEFTIRLSKGYTNAYY